MEGDAAVIASVCWQRGQGNFELAANFGYSSRGSVDPRESLRKRRISKLPYPNPPTLGCLQTEAMTSAVRWWKLLWLVW